MKKLTLFVLLIAIAMPAVAALSRADAASVNNLLDDYVAAWLAGNQEGVMRLLIPASVLVPGEKPPYVGREAIRNYWWPAGAPPFRLDRFENTRDEILGSDGIAIIRGTQVIEWTSGAERWRTHGNYLTVVRKTSAGWRIAIQMAGNGENERLR